MTGVAPTAMLDPALLAGIGDLELLARTVVDGFLHGPHRSSRTGLSLDFAEHRPYQPGDDLRRIDWRVYGRTDRFYLKTYEAETNADLRCGARRLGVDGLRFRGAHQVRLGAGAARLARLAVAAPGRSRGIRAAGCRDLGDRAALHPPPQPGAAGAVADASRGRMALGACLDRIAALQGRAGMLVIVSDCYDEPRAIQHGLAALRGRGHDVMLFHVIDPAERDFPYDAAETFEDLESEARLALKPDEIRPAYRAAFQAHGDALRRICGADGIDYVPVFGDEPLDRALRSWLEHRRRPELAR